MSFNRGCLQAMFISNRWSVSVLWGNVTPWDSCNDDWFIDWPVLRYFNFYKEWVIHIFGKSCILVSSHLNVHRMGIRQSCGPKSLWSICLQSKGQCSSFCWWCSKSLEVLWMAFKTAYLRLVTIDPLCNEIRFYDNLHYEICTNWIF